MCRDIYICYLFIFIMIIYLVILNSIDKNPNSKEESEMMFKRVGEAFQILSDPEKRSNYDTFGHGMLRFSALHVVCLIGSKIFQYFNFYTSNQTGPPFFSFLFFFFSSSSFLNLNRLSIFFIGVSVV